MMPSNPTIEAVISDLGRVVFNFSYMPCFEFFARELDCPLEELRARFTYDEVLAQLERGEITTADYCRHVGEMIGFPISLDVFEKGWSTIYQEPVAGYAEVLEQLRRQVRLVALSNTNASHARIWAELYKDIMSNFEHIFSSHDIGARKPEPRSYQVVLDYLDIAPEQIVFIDDVAENVDAARELGLNGIVMTTTPELIPQLQAFGLDVQ